MLGFSPHESKSRVWLPIRLPGWRGLLHGLFVWHGCLISSFRRTSRNPQAWPSRDASSCRSSAPQRCGFPVRFPIAGFGLSNRCLWKKHSSGEKYIWEDKLSEHQIRGRKEMLATGLHGQGSHERSALFADAGVLTWLALPLPPLYPTCPTCSAVVVCCPIPHACVSRGSLSLSQPLSFLRFLIELEGPDVSLEGPSLSSSCQGRRHRDYGHVSYQYQDPTN